ncbi:MAG: MaoC family dehydratase [Gemmataceae bacterium]|nr:MaoC family dehydratase [Gemmataceae bacterium]
MPARVIEGAEALRALVGQEVGVSDWFTVDQALIDSFAKVTADRQWIHVDADRARAESPYGSTIAHGFLTLSLLSQLHGQAVQVQGGSRFINYGLNRVRFPAAVPAGSRVRTRSTLQALEEVPGGLQLIWAIVVELEGSAKPALVAEWLLRWYE